MLSSPLLLYRSWARQSVCRKHELLRYMSCSAKAHAKESSHAKSPGHDFHRDEQDIVTFESLGVRTPIAESLRAAFPDVQKPTTMQRKLISAVVGKQDILLQDFTGTGKWVVPPSHNAVTESIIFLGHLDCFSDS